LIVLANANRRSSEVWRIPADMNESKSTLPKVGWREIAAEFLGTAFLLAGVVGSGIMAERLAQGNVALALLANSLATGALLVALILAFGPTSGAHFNPVVTLAEAIFGRLSWKTVPSYLMAQIFGGLLGVAAANRMFDLPLFVFSRHVRTGGGQWMGEFVATLGLLLVIVSCAKGKPTAVPYAVGSYITAAYWFTSSTSFANPAVTIARCVTDTFAGIRPQDVMGFILAQMAGTAAAVLLCWFWGKTPQGEPAGAIGRQPAVGASGLK
jgi:glycerol uptake facilitator-like aquaporin